MPQLLHIRFISFIPVLEGVKTWFMLRANLLIFSGLFDLVFRLLAASSHTDGRVDFPFQSCTYQLKNCSFKANI